MHITVEHLVCNPETVKYNFYSSMVGNVMIASTDAGICFLGFSDDKALLFDELNAVFPTSTLQKQSDDWQLLAARFLFNDKRTTGTLHLLLKGTPFQMKVWHYLLSVSAHQYVTYGELAAMVGSPKAAQAVGSAVGRNPIAYFVPCHRILAKQGIGGFKWGVDCKRAIIDWEKSNLHNGDAQLSAITTVSKLT